MYARTFKRRLIELNNILTCHSSQIPRHNEFHIAFRPGMYIDPVGILYYKIEFQKLVLFFMPFLNFIATMGAFEWSITYLTINLIRSVYTIKNTVTLTP